MSKILKRSLLVISSLAVSELLSLQICYADLEFKKKVIDKCDEALADLNALPEAERQQLIPDLQLILKLQSNQVDNLRPDVVGGSQRTGQFDAPFDELRADDIWKSFEPNRDLRAKKCAVRLLLALSPYSFSTLPDLIKLAADQTLPPDFYGTLSDAITEISLAAANVPELELSPDMVRDLLALVNERPAYHAENVLLELRERTIPILLKEVHKPDAKLRDLIVEVLLKIDDSGELIGGGVLQLLDSADDGLRRRAAMLLAELEHVYSESVPALINSLNDLSPGVEEASANSLATIAAMHPKQPAIVINEKHLSILFSAFERNKHPLKESLGRALSAFGPLAPGYYDRILVALKSSDAGLRTSIVEVLGDTRSTSPLMTNTLVGALSDKAPSVRISAVRAIGKQKGSDEFITAFTKLLKAGSKESSAEMRQLEALEVAKAALNLNLGTKASPLIPSFVDALAQSDLTIVNRQGGVKTLSESGHLSEYESHSASLALKMIGAEAVPAVIKGLSTKSLDYKRRAIALLSLITPMTAGTAQTLSQYLKGPELRHLAAEALIRGGKAAIPATKKVYNAPNLPAKLEAAKVLIALGERDKGYFNLVIDSSRKDNCEGKAHLAVTVPELKTQAPVSFYEDLVKCLDSNPSQAEKVLVALQAVAPVPPQAATLLFQFLNNESASKKIQLQLLEQAPTLGLSTDNLFPVLMSNLYSGDKALKFRVLSVLKSLGASAKGAVPRLLDFLKDNRDDQLLANEAALALTSIDSSSFDYVAFFVEGLKDDGYQWAKNSINKLSPGMAFPVLERALDNLPESKKGRAVELAGEFASTTGPLLPKLRVLLDSPNPELRFKTVVAVAKIDPLAPELAEPLKRELRGEYRSELLSERWPPELAPALQQIIKESQSYVEKKMAELLLRNIKK